MSVKGSVLTEHTLFEPLLTARMRRAALYALCLILGGMLAIPMVPGWQLLSRVLAGALLFVGLSGFVSTTWRHTLTALLLLGATVFAIGWIHSAAIDPGRHVIGIVTDVYGLALPLYGGLGLTLLDGALLGGFGVMLLRQHTAKQARIGFGLALFIWAYSLLSPLAQGLGGGADPELLAQMLAGSSRWASWVLLMGLCLVLIETTQDVHALIRAAILGGLAMASVMTLQFMLADFSYVLDSSNLQDYFYRVRGTAYYHAPATYTVAVALLLCLGVIHANLAGTTVKEIFASWQWIFSAVGLAALAALNDTRAMNVALVVALVLMLLIVLRRRDWGSMILVLVLAATIGADLLYVKPLFRDASTPELSEAVFADLVNSLKLPPPPSISTTGMDVLLPSIGQASGDTMQTIVGSNSVRLILLNAGLNSLTQHLILGSGVGTLVLNLGGLAGLESTYSTHMLYLDMALMAGLPALLAFLTLLAYSAWIGIKMCVSPTRNSKQLLAPALLCSMVVLGIGAIFLPQERNHIIALFFVFSGLLLVLGSTAPDLVTPELPRGVKPKTEAPLRLTLLSCIWGVGALGWGALTSSTYTLPVLNVVARHANDIAINNSRVYVTESATIPLTKSLLWLRGVREPRVQLLQDDPSALPGDNSYVVWLPARDVHYPNLRKALGYRLVRPGSDAASIETPPNWWMMPVIPYAGYLFFTNTLPAEKVFSEAIEVRSLPPNTPLWPNVGRFLQFAQRGETVGTHPPDLLDMNPGTYRLWNTAKPPEFYFDMNSLSSTALRAYRLLPPTRLDEAHTRKLSWIVQGSKDLLNWVTIDRREVRLSGKAEDISGLAICNPRAFRYLRFQFLPKKTPTMITGLGEIELYPGPVSNRFEKQTDCENGNE